MQYMHTIEAMEKTVSQKYHITLLLYFPYILTVAAVSFTEFTVCLLAILKFYIQR